MPYTYVKYGIGQSFNNSYYAVVDKYFQVIRTDSISILEAKSIMKLYQNNNLTEGLIIFKKRSIKFDKYDVC